MQVSEVMSPNVILVHPSDTVVKAAQLMKDRDIGSIPVGADDRLQGMITDRDIAIYGVASGRDIEQCTVKECMSEKERVIYCYEDDDLETASKKMAENKVRRLPVLNRNKRLVGLVSLGDLAEHEESRSFVHKSLKEITH